ncbi:MAG: M81 family metallopeptidase [Woeseiaceae bacterium]|jgi:microcystin degradation protein MlrC|nr:M81 family metallopeptidase [Woeseiaceae bacterium]
MKRIAGLLAVIVCATVSCTQEPVPTQEQDKLRFAVMTFAHETCTFCPGGDSDIERWTKIRAPYVGDEVLTAGTYMRGFVAAAREYKDIELIGLESPAGVFGGSSASWSTEEAFEHFMGRMLDDLREAMPVDGVYMALHGAMAVRNIPRPEAEIARRFREIVGPDVPIIGSFDLHGNEDEEFLKWADMAFVTKRYPHYDSGIQGARSARSLIRIARGSYSPTTATRKPGVITPTVLQWTGKTPAMDIMERARRWEAREEDVFVSVFYGFPWADVPDVGATVHVMTNDDPQLANEIADDMSEYIWRVREELFGEPLAQPDVAAARATAAFAAGATPIVFADYSDRSGDATHILREVVDQKLSGVLVATIRDERVLESLQQSDAKVGDLFNMEVGGFTGPASGTPVSISGTLSYIGPGMRFDQVAIVDFGDRNSLIITPALKQVLWTEELEFGPLDPDNFDSFVVKSRVHFRRGFDETGYAKTIILVDAPGPFVGTVHLDALQYENVTLENYYPYGTPPDRQ